MKTLKALFLVEILFQLTCNGQNNTVIKPGFANISTLIVDYDTYQFEGGNMSYYYCPICPNDRLPFLFDYKSPGDFGGIKVILKSTLDILFDATIIWMGKGEIKYPTNLNLNYPFTYSTHPISKALDLVYFKTDGKISDDSCFIQKADSAWDVISSLEIAHIFSNHNSKAGIYLYPPTVGLFDPSVAKWVVFLYSSDIADCSRNLQDHSIDFYPNPTKSIITLNYNENQAKTLLYLVCDPTGNVLDKGILNQSKNQVDFSLFPKGMYFLMILNDIGSYLGIEKIIKE